MNGMIDLGIELRIKEVGEGTFPQAITVKVKGMPATGQAGGNVEITTSSDAVKLYVADRPDTGDMDFTYNYTSTNYETVDAFCDNTEKDILIKLPDGAGFRYQGTVQTWVNEVSVGSAIEATLHTVASTAPEYLDAEAVTALIATA